MDIPIQTLKELLCGCDTKSPAVKSSLEPRGENTITVLDRGFVYVGKTRVEGDYVEITNARNIRPAFGQFRRRGVFEGGGMISERIQAILETRYMLSGAETPEQKLKIAVGLIEQMVDSENGYHAVLDAVFSSEGLTTRDSGKGDRE